MKQISVCIWTFIVLLDLSFVSYAEELRYRIVGDNIVIDKNTVAGFAQIRIEEKWFSLCSHGWEKIDATLFCETLGYDRGVHYQTHDSSFDPPNETVWQTEIRCKVTNRNFSQCDTRDLASDCSPAYVTCDRIDPDLQNGMLRLTSSTTPYSGRVEVAYNGLWGAICDRYWDETTAGAVCGMLGFNQGGLPIKYSSFYPGMDVFLDDVKCELGSETNITECMRRSFLEQYCNNYRTSGVLCYQEHMENQTGQIRLNRGLSPNEGLVQINYQGVWGDLCFKDWTQAETSVVCSQLGFDSGRSSSKKFMSAYSPSWWNFVSCQGNESRISDCKHDVWSSNGCSVEDEIKIQCFNKDGEATKEEPEDKAMLIIYCVLAVLGAGLSLLSVAVCIRHRRQHTVTIVKNLQTVTPTCKNAVYHMDTSFPESRVYRATSEQYDYIDDSRDPAYLELLDADIKLSPRTNTPLPRPPSDCGEYLTLVDTLTIRSDYLTTTSDSPPGDSTHVKQTDHAEHEYLQPVTARKPSSTATTHTYINEELSKSGSIKEELENVENEAMVRNSIT